MTDLWCLSIALMPYCYSGDFYQLMLEIRGWLTLFARWDGSWVFLYLMKLHDNFGRIDMDYFEFVQAKD